MSEVELQNARANGTLDEADDQNPEANGSPLKRRAAIRSRDFLPAATGAATSAFADKFESKFASLTKTVHELRGARESSCFGS